MRAKWRQLLGEEIAEFIVALRPHEKKPNPEEVVAWKSEFDRPARRGGLTDDQIASEARLCLQIARSILRDASTPTEVSERALATYRSLHTRPATEARIREKDERVARVRELRSQRLSVSMIAIRMTKELGRDPDKNPVSERQVSRWLADKKKG
jgi:hypothetical protein